MEVCDVIHRPSIWQRPKSHFNTASLASALALKRMLSNLDKPES